VKKSPYNHRDWTIMKKFSLQRYIIILPLLDLFVAAEKLKTIDSN
jgi:hypothetical protein